MSIDTIKTSSTCSRATDLIVLTISFLLFSLVVGKGAASTDQLLMNMAFYVGVVFVALRLSKRFFFEHLALKSRMLRILLGNTSGLLVGTILSLLLEQLFPGLGERAVVFIFSSVLAFFILGTLSPMVKSSHHDIITH